MFLIVYLFNKILEFYVKYFLIMPPKANQRVPSKEIKMTDKPEESSDNSDSDYSEQIEEEKIEEKLIEEAKIEKEKVSQVK